MSSKAPDPLDPDLVRCPKATCPAGPGEVCRTPSGKKAARIHPERRRLAAAGGVERSRANVEQTSGKSKPVPATKASRSKGGKAASQARRRRRAEIEAQAEQLRVEEERRVAAEHAEQLAQDALRYTRDRATLKRHVLDSALKAHERLVESLVHLHAPAGYDEEGRPRTKPVELFTTERGVRKRVVDADGTPAVREEPDVVGYWSVQQVESLAKAAGAALNSLRLEEGKATGITAETSGAAANLGDEGVAKLIEYAQQNLDPGGGPK